MKHIIYGYDQEAFNRAALAHVEKLTFNTRSEYLAWVKQWKEDYRCLSVARRIERLNRYTTQPKIDRANKLIEKLNVQCPNEKYTEIVDRLANLSCPPSTAPTTASSSSTGSRAHTTSSCTCSWSERRASFEPPSNAPHESPPRKRWPNPSPTVKSGAFRWYIL